MSALQQVIYADVLIFFNTVITFILLLTVRAFVNVGSSSGRIMLASLVGGVYSLIILAPKMHFLLMLLAKTGMCVSITCIAFHAKSFRNMLRCAVLFAASSYLFAGVVYAISFIVQSEYLIVNNGFPYIQISIISMIIICVIVYAVLFLLRKTVFRMQEDDMLYNLHLSFSGEEIDVLALLDSGNSIRDIYTGKPVIILTSERAIQLTGSEIPSVFTDWTNLNGSVKWRLLPVHALDGDKLLPVFNADAVRIAKGSSNKTLASVCVAVTNDPLGNGRYQALLSRDFI